MKRALALLAGAALLAGCGSAVSGVASPMPIPATTAAVVAPQQVPDPTGIQIPKLGVQASLVPTGRDGDTWQIPADARQPSWFAPGPEPGEPGPAVVLGHVDYNHQPGVFQRLHELAPGDQILILHADAVRTFEVRTVRALPKDQFSPGAVLGAGDPAPRLVLITCGGELERTARGGRYLDNTIVTAIPVPA